MRRTRAKNRRRLEFLSADRHERVLPHVPADYESIAMAQRARVLRHGLAHLRIHRHRRHRLDRLRVRPDAWRRAMAYQVITAPAGAIIATLPSGCRSVRVNNVAYSQCGPTYYQRVATGYRVVVL